MKSALIIGTSKGIGLETELAFGRSTVINLNHLSQLTIHPHGSKVCSKPSKDFFISPCREATFMGCLSA